ncbi:non-oxidative hydroxyarylic acid decarboxylases subunit C [Ktedonospora formicarum]|uniref:Phenolic acid decarboxylase n=1 Tax=Ktedonospora formicarum TaxID=2778364 RepID=A0A8J3MX27_9CHLR|nr:non-oxidative hydroxyarylic acid decarboxylases subunit C [Ktedonospora formicarum]GHO50995.1 phenolic acid decarboxylase subunit C [Ktedonospora formicarum]
MAYKDFRAFLQRLRDEGQLLHIKQQVRLEPDLGSAGRAVTRLGANAPALFFDNIYGYKQGKAIAMNIIGSWANHALMLNMPKHTPIKEQFFEFVRRWEQFPVPVKRMDNAPFYEHEVSKNINLFEMFPFFRLNDYDGGFYIDKACIISKDLDDPDSFGKQNVGIYRAQVKGKNHLGIQPVPMHDIGIHLRKAEERNENLPIALAIGCEPVITTIAGSPLLYDQSEYEMAGAIQGEAYPIVRGKRTGLDLPWGAEIVIEGEVIARKREPEGPFGEFTGSYSGGRNMPIIEVHAVYHRENPILEDLYLGTPWTEIDYMLALNTCVPLYQQLKDAFPEIIAVNAMYTHGLLAIISTRTRYGGFAKAVGLRAMTTPHGLGYCKIVIVVDEDVDPFDLNQVMWALSTRFAPSKDLVLIPNASILPLDPSAEPAGITHKMVLDATIPVDPDIRGEFAQPLTPPAATDQWEKILRDLLQKNTERCNLPHENLPPL